MVISRCPNTIMYFTSVIYKLMEDKYTQLTYIYLDIYPVCKINEFRGTEFKEFMGWSILGIHYVKNNIKNIPSILIKHRHELKVILRYRFTQGY